MQFPMRGIRVLRGTPNQHIPVPRFRIQIGNNNDNSFSKSVSLSSHDTSIDHQLNPFIINNLEEKKICNSCYTITISNIASFCQYCGGKLEKKTKNKKRSPLYWNYIKEVKINRENCKYLLVNIDNNNLIICCEMRQLTIYSLEGLKLSEITNENNLLTDILIPGKHNSLLIYYIGYGIKEFNPFTGELLNEILIAQGILCFHTNIVIYIITNAGINCIDKDTLEIIRIIQPPRNFRFLGGYSKNHIYFYTTSNNGSIIYRCTSIDEFESIITNEYTLEEYLVYKGNINGKVILSHDYNTGIDNLIILGNNYISCIDMDHNNIKWGYNFNSNDMKQLKPVIFFHHLLLFQSSAISLNGVSGLFSHKPLKIHHLFKSRITGGAAIGNILILTMDDKSIRLFSSEICSLKELCVRVIVQYFEKHYQNLQYFEYDTSTIIMIKKELEYQNMWNSSMKNLFKQRIKTY